MKVAIDTGPIKGGDAVRGVGMYTRELLCALKETVKNIKIYEVDAFSTDLSRYDIVHFPNFKPYFLSLPETKSTKTIITIHDTIPLIYPKQYPAGLRGNLVLRKNKRLLEYTDAAVTVSESSKKDIVRLLNVPAQKVYVTHLGAKKVFRQTSNSRLLAVVKKYNLTNKFALYVGDVNYNKNIPTLINACKIAGLPLVICGKNAFVAEEYENDLKMLKGPRDWMRYLFGKQHPEAAHYVELAKLFAENKVIRTGFVQDDELAAIYNLAAVYVQPSYYEGFGLGVLEAMACGVPVVISRTQALTEVAGGAALICDPYEALDMADKIKEATKSENRKLFSKKGLERVKEFSWKKCAAETIAVYKKVLSEG
jgi:glycosyltransferase involved in cell wall biosynthesis